MNHPFMHPAPQQLRELVLDYLCHSGYLGTARAFIRDTAVRELDADGDEVMSTESEDSVITPELTAVVQLRRDVRERIVSGRITEATEVLNDRLPVLLSKSPSETAAVPVIPSLSSSLTSKQYSPSASVEPIHLSLNLRIMAFIELCRTVRLDYPPPSTPSNEPPPYAHDPELKERQLALVRKLWADVQLLEKASDREAYLEEVKNVMFILAFDAPEKKTPAKYLSQARREAVADQIDCAILCQSGLPPISNLELYIRYTSTLWKMLTVLGLEVPPQTTWPSGIRLPVSADHQSSLNKDISSSEPKPTFDLRQFLNWRP